MDLGQFTAAYDADSMGLLPDGRISNTTSADWLAVCRLLEQLGLPVHFTRDGEAAERPDFALLFGEDVLWTVSVTLDGGALVIFRCYSEASIDFDLCLAELNDATSFANVQAFVVTMGAALGRRVDVGDEGLHRRILHYDPAKNCIVPG